MWALLLRGEGGLIFPPGSAAIFFGLLGFCLESCETAVISFFFFYVRNGDGIDRFPPRAQNGESLEGIFCDSPPWFRGADGCFSRSCAILPLVLHFEDGRI